MSPTEFRAWFEGFTEAMDRRPNAKQWARIKKRVAEITPESTPTPIFIDRWVRPYRGWWYTPTFSLSGSSPAADVSSNTVMNCVGAEISNTPAFTHIGRMEALEL